MELKDYVALLNQMSRNEVAEELVYYRKQAVGLFRNDEGTTFDGHYFEFWAQLRVLEAKATELGLMPQELQDAQRRIEAREKLYRRLYRHACKLV